MLVQHCSPGSSPTSTRREGEGRAGVVSIRTLRPPDRVAHILAFAQRGSSASPSVRDLALAQIDPAHLAGGGHRQLINEFDLVRGEAC